MTALRSNIRSHRQRRELGAWEFPVLRKNPVVPAPEACERPGRTVPGEAPQQDAVCAEPDRYEEGFATGQAAAEDALRAEFDQHLLREQQVLAHLADSLRDQLVQFQAVWERDAVRLVLVIAERVVKREVVLDDELVLRQIQEAIRRVWGVDRLKLRINPADEEYVKAQRPLLSSVSDSVRDFVIEADATIERGGCMIESEAGNIDARVSTQLRQIEAGLLPQLAEEELK